MPVFEYKGLNAQSKNVKGTVDADSEKAARSKLRKMKIYPTKIVPEGQGGGLKNIRLFKSISVKDVAGMTRQLSILLNANIPLIDSLAATQDQTENPDIRKALGDIKEKVSEGSRLGDCMQSYPKIFDPIYIHMVKAGEASGALDIILARLAEYKEGQDELKSKVTSAMTYPILMVVGSVAMLAYLFTEVIPKIAGVIKKQKAALPLPTEIVLGITEFVQNYWLLVLIFFAILIFGFRYWKKTPKGHQKFDEMMLRVPLFGKLTLKIAVARFSRTLSTLLSSGVQLLQALGIVKNVMNNVVLEKMVAEVMVDVKEGENLADTLKATGQFPSMFLHMIAVGEKTGQLEEMLDKVASTYSKEVENYIDAMTSLLTPVMLIFMGGMIGFIVFAVLLPILQLTQSV